MGSAPDAGFFAVKYMYKGQKYQAIISQEQLRKIEKGDTLLQAISQSHSQSQNWHNWWSDTVIATLSGISIGVAINYLIGNRPF